jgi:hypothetical protein
MGRAEPRKRAPISTAAEQHEMRAFRPKSFRQQATSQQAASEASRSNGLTDAQQKAMRAEFRRRIAEFDEAWRCCRDGRCRRRRQCLGPPFACNSKGSERPFTDRQYRRLKRDVVRKPPKVLQGVPRSA